MFQTAAMKIGGRRALLACVLFLPLGLLAGDLPIRFDGLYRYQESKDGVVVYNKYLRFSSDGTVIGVSTHGSPSQIRRWFTAHHPGVATGRFLQSGGRVTFSLNSDAGSVTYEGRATGNQMTLKSISRINGHSGVETYTYVPDDTQT